MIVKMQRFAPLGLYLALLAAIVSVGLYIVYREWNLPLQISLAFIVIGLALFAVLDPARLRSTLTGRQARYGSNAFIMLIAVLGILVVINVLAYQNPVRWDLTEDKTFTLAKETIETLQKLPEPVTAQAFFTPQTSSTEAQGLLDQFKLRAKGKFDYEFINPLNEPGLSQAANITTDGSLALFMGDRRENVTSVSENEITSALVRLMSDKVSVYFLTGHGELTPEDSGDLSLSTLQGLLEEKNYTIQTLSLLNEKNIPEDAGVVVIAGPEKPLTEAEITTLTDYMNNGGSLVVMDDTPLRTSMTGDADTLGNYLSEAWGIYLADDLVLDFQSDSPAVVYADQFGNHAITNEIRVPSAFIETRSITTTRDVEGATITNLVTTGPNSYAETDLAGLLNNTTIEVNEGQDTQGPVTVAVVAENNTQQSRLVVFGDRDFASNQYINALGNSQVVVNTIDWAAAQESLINLAPKDTTTRLLVAPTQVSLGLILLGSVFVLPGLVVVYGIIVWVQRRRRG